VKPYEIEEDMEVEHTVSRRVGIVSRYGVSKNLVDIRWDDGEVQTLPIDFIRRHSAPDVPSAVVTVVKVKAPYIKNPPVRNARQLTKDEWDVLLDGGVRGFTRRRLRELGVPWPLRKGWKQKLVKRQAKMDPKSSHVSTRTLRSWGVKEWQPSPVTQYEKRVLSERIARDKD
jgi:hypothetical protein